MRVVGEGEEGRLLLFGGVEKDELEVAVDEKELILPRGGGGVVDGLGSGASSKASEDATRVATNNVDEGVGGNAAGRFTWAAEAAASVKAKRGRRWAGGGNDTAEESRFCHENPRFPGARDALVDQTSERAREAQVGRPSEAGGVQIDSGEVAVAGEKRGRRGREGEGDRGSARRREDRRELLCAREAAAVSAEDLVEKFRVVAVGEGGGERQVVGRAGDGKPEGRDRIRADGRQGRIGRKLVDQGWEPRR